jgi:hypothetical protein
MPRERQLKCVRDMSDMIRHVDELEERQQAPRLSEREWAALESERLRARQISRKEQRRRRRLK